MYGARPEEIARHTAANGMDALRQKDATLVAMARRALEPVETSDKRHKGDDDLPGLWIGRRRWPSAQEAKDDALKMARAAKRAADPTQAEELMRAALAVTVHTEGPRHPSSAARMQEYGRWLVIQARGSKPTEDAWGQGLALLEQAAAILKEAFGSGHQRTQQAYTELAQSLQARGATPGEIKARLQGAARPIDVAGR